jgi:hypothetical protein
MNGFFSAAYDTAKSFFKTILSQRRGYYDISSDERAVKQKSPLSDFLSEKIPIRFDVNIKRGVLALISALLIFILSMIIASTIKKIGK